MKNELKLEVVTDLKKKLKMRKYQCQNLLLLKARKPNRNGAEEEKDEDRQQTQNANSSIVTPLLILREKNEKTENRKTKRNSLKRVKQCLCRKKNLQKQREIRS